MIHIWIKDELYEPAMDSSHTKKWSCEKCNATLHEWIGFKNGKLKKFYYIFVKDTQYGLDYKCTKNFNYEKNDCVSTVTVGSDIVNGQYAFNFGE